MEHFTVSGVIVPMKCNITHFDYNCEAYFKISKINLLVEKKNGRKFSKTLTVLFFFLNRGGRIIGSFLSFFFFFLLSKEILKKILELDQLECKYQSTQLCDSGQIIELEFSFIK